MPDIYTENEILSDELSAHKAQTALFNTSVNECVHENVRQTMTHILNEEYEIGQDVFEMMPAKGLCLMEVVY